MINVQVRLDNVVSLIKLYSLVVYHSMNPFDPLFKFPNWL